MTERPLILISNDDGYSSLGIDVLTRVALEFGDVAVVAPMTPQSGKASAITTDRPLIPRMIENTVQLRRWVVDGTPADCAKLALDQLLRDTPPTLVLSGINHGANTGISAMYSGTMGVAFEGLLHGVPSIAYSLNDYSADAKMETCVEVIRHITAQVLKHGLPRHICLNVNIPLTSDGKFAGYKATTGALGRWAEEFERRTRPVSGTDYYWMVGTYDQFDPADDTTDLYWMAKNYVSVTPCHIDQTDHGTLGLVGEMIGELED